MAVAAIFLDENALNTCAAAAPTASCTVELLNSLQRRASFSSAPALPLPVVSKPHVINRGGTAHCHVRQTAKLTQRCPGCTHACMRAAEVKLHSPKVGL